MKAYSQDLRQRILDTVQGGDGTLGQIARRFLVSVSFITRLLQLHRSTGSLEPRPHGGGNPAILSPEDLQQLRELVQKQPDATLEELRQRLGASCSLMTLSRALRPLGLKVSQLNILIVTARLGLVRPTQVCEILQLDTSTLSRNVERMRAHGWLEVVPDEDARTQPFRLTAQGRRLIEKAVPAWEEAQRQAAELLGEEGITLLDRAAKKLRQAGVEA